MARWKVTYTDTVDTELPESAIAIAAEAISDDVLRFFKRFATAEVIEDVDGEERESR